MKRNQRLGIALWALVFAGCSQGPPTILGPAPTKVTKRVFVIVGPLAFPDKENRGYMNNPAFVLTDKGVVVIDPGSSAAVGQMVLEKIRSFTDQPVVAVFNTHIHGDHWLANGAIKRAHPAAVIYAHPKMKAKAADDGPTWVRLFDQLTGGAMAGTVPVGPDLGIEDGEVLKIGGIAFQVHHTGRAHTDGDIMVEVPQERVLFTGDIINHRAVRRMDDGSFKGNIAAIDRVLASTAIHLVPGHGAPGTPAMAREYRRYFATLYGTVKKLYDEGKPDFEIKPKVVEALAAFADWDAFKDEVGRQVSLAYLEAEQEAF